MKTKTTMKTSWGDLHVEFEQNFYGFFAIEANGLRWPYEVCDQVASKTPIEAIEALLEHHTREG